MKSKLLERKYFSTLLLFLAIFNITQTSCSKSDEYSSSGTASVSVSLGGIKYAETESANNGGRSLINGQASQIVEIPFDSERVLIAELKQESSSVNTSLHASRALKSSTVNVLGKGIKYRVIVYEKSGVYKDQKLYTVGSEKTEGAFNLDGNKEYIFVAYSFGNAKTLVEAPKVSFSTVILYSTLNLAGDDAWLHVKKTVAIQSGENNLSLILENKLSQVTAVINAFEIGAISSVNALILDHRNSITNLKADGTFTTPTFGTSKSLVFPSLNEKIITSNPAVICNPGTTDVSFSMGRLTINGVERNLTVYGLRILPGYKYTLNVSIKSSGIAVGNLVWAKGNLTYNNGVYLNRNNPEETGYNYKLTDYWNFSSLEIPLLPAMNTTYNAMSPGITYPVNDPCRQIAGGNWRMPTLADFLSLGPLFVIDAKNVANQVLTGFQPNGLGNTDTGTKDEAGYIYFNGIDELSNKGTRLKFFAGGGLRGTVVNNIPLFETNISNFNDYNVIYLASDSQAPNPNDNKNGVPGDLLSSVIAPPTFFTLNDNNDFRFTFLSHRFVHTDSDKVHLRPYRDSRFPIRCVRDK